MNTLPELAQILSRHSFASEQMEPTLMPRLSIFRADRSTTRTPAIYHPLFCLVVSGRKQVFFGEKTSEYGPGDCFLVTVDLPVVGTVLEALPENPYLALCLDLHHPTLAEIAIRATVTPNVTQGSDRGLQVGTATTEVIDAAFRLAQLLDNTQHIDVLAPLYEQELLYRLYVGPWGRSLYAASQASSRLSQVGRAIAWLHEHYATDYTADELAKIAGMSVSTLNRHFREITAMSPLEYQKCIRLQEARRLLASQVTDVAGTGYAVGYSSPSQFNREYRRLFGESPGRYASQVRSAKEQTQHSA
ncbi:AraC family transcriptional regulator [Mastigocladopsis repens]|uniref:AraC family transcriptional regulator n=1 Tax=Mastigocladopsis repens TaxID=221287 RepID=UPI0002DB386D|nr:AraC family transcriptional regulator [Mastigocladopsis repens]